MLSKLYTEDRMRAGLTRKGASTVSSMVSPWRENRASIVVHRGRSNSRALASPLEGRRGHPLECPPISHRLPSYICVAIGRDRDRELTVWDGIYMMGVVC